MIGRFDEYQKMFRLEGQLWWYRNLHERVEAALCNYFPDCHDIALLDAGCGTGGLLQFLTQKGYTNLRGIDGSADAVTFCQERGFEADLVDLNHLSEFEPRTQYDAIVCNDVFCYFLGSELERLLNELARRLKPGGVLISNNNAFRIFKGQHDLAVGIKRRFTRPDFESLLPKAGLYIRYATYWSFILSPVILVMRQWQNLQLRLGWRAPEAAQSDVYLPAAWLNEMLYWIVKAEQKLLTRTPFGSSLFIVVVGHS
ncbi:class I SAM-dependent methyltransferase [Spirosoma knui]